MDKFATQNEVRCYTLDYVEQAITENEHASRNPEAIQKCLQAGHLPACYENTAIEVELQQQTVMSCFSLNDKGAVTCPTGAVLSPTKKKGKSTIYANKDACRQCLNKCTGSRGHKTVSFGLETQIVPVRMYGTV